MVSYVFKRNPYDKKLWSYITHILYLRPIRVVEEDREGIVWDGTGATVHQDIDYQLDRDFVSMRFYGFESALHGIDRYEWAIGSQPRYDDVMPFTSYGIIVTDENTFGM